MKIIVVFIIVLVAVLTLWLAFSKKKDSQKPVVYSCQNCGEHHCDCYREDEPGTGTGR